mgnify:CR=1 FL=1
MNLSEQLARWLEPQFPASVVTHGFMPETPDRCIAVYGADLRTLGDSDGARLQIRVRGDRTASMAADDAQVLANLLDDYHDGVWVPDAAYIIRVHVESGPAHIGADQNNRQEYTLNLRVWTC